MLHFWPRVSEHTPTSCAASQLAFEKPLCICMFYRWSLLRIHFAKRCDITEQEEIVSEWVVRAVFLRHVYSMSMARLLHISMICLPSLGQRVVIDYDCRVSRITVVDRALPGVWEIKNKSDSQVQGRGWSSLSARKSPNEAVHSTRNTSTTK